MELALTSNGSLTPLAYILSTIGAVVCFKTLVSFSIVVLSGFIRRGEPLSKYGAKKGSFAVITGSTQGIGLAFAQKLAKAGFNLFLVSRTQESLDQVAGDIASKYPDIITKTFAIDVAKASRSEFSALGNELSSLNIGILVNNVGISHEFPTPFEQIMDQTIEDMININCLAQLRITKLILPGMMQRRNGLILNLGSFAGYIPSALLSVYSGTKGFLRLWSQSLAEEVKSKGVRVELLNTSYVVSSLSKIRKPKWDTPTPNTFVDVVLRSVGIGYSEPFLRAPYWAHALTQWVVDHVSTTSLSILFIHKMHIDIRKRALKKQARLAQAAVEKKRFSQYVVGFTFHDKFLHLKTSQQHYSC